MTVNHNGMVSQPKAEALQQAAMIKEALNVYEGRDLGYGLVFNGGALVSRFADESSPYLLGQNGEPLTFFHYRNLSTVHPPGNSDFHDLMHFGTLRAAHSRAFSKRLLQEGQQFSEDLLVTGIFNRCANESVRPGSAFGDEVILAAAIRAKSPYFIPDIGQTQYFQNRAVLYACGLFDVEEVDRELFNEEGYPVDDINRKVLDRLRERGYDSVAYLNEIEDPDSLSLIILCKDQAEAVDLPVADFPGFRYGFGPSGSTRIVECDSTRNVRIIDSKVSPVYLENF